MKKYQKDEIKYSLWNMRITTTDILKNITQIIEEIEILESKLEDMRVENE